MENVDQSHLVLASGKQGLQKSYLAVVTFHNYVLTHQILGFSKMGEMNKTEGNKGVDPSDDFSSSVAKCQRRP